MVQCAVKGCKSRSDVHMYSKLDTSGVHFHRVPQNPQIRKKWMKAINKCDIKDSTRVCSLHFSEQNYYETKNGSQKLLKTAVPDFNLHTDGNVNEDTTDSSGDETPNMQPLEQNINNSSQSQAACSEIRPEFEIVNVESTIESVVKNKKEKMVKTPLERRLLKKVKRLQELSKQRMEAITCLEEQNRRLLTRNSFLQQALDKYQKVPEEVNTAALQESEFFEDFS